MRNWKFKESDFNDFPVYEGRDLGITWTRDPFDRIIVAQAKIRNSALVTRDREIRLHYSKAVW